MRLKRVREHRSPRNVLEDLYGTAERRHAVGAAPPSAQRSAQPGAAANVNTAARARITVKTLESLISGEKHANKLVCFAYKDLT